MRFTIILKVDKLKNISIYRKYFANNDALRISKGAAKLLYSVTTKISLEKNTQICSRPMQRKPPNDRTHPTETTIIDDTFYIKTSICRHSTMYTPKSVSITEQLLST